MSNGKLTHRVVEDGTVLVLEREFTAPRELVFEMFSDCKHLMHWWGPRGFDLTACEMDFREGGTWLYCMKCVDPNMGDMYGIESWGKQVFHEIRRPSSISYTDYFTDSEGTVNDQFPATDAVVEFIDQGNSTKVVSRSKYATAEDLQTVTDMGMLQGIAETWDRLQERLDAVR